MMWLFHFPEKIAKQANVSGQILGKERMEGHTNVNPKIVIYCKPAIIIRG